MFFRKKKYVSSGSLSVQSWRRFKKNRIALVSLFFLFFLFFISVLGYLITPDQTPFANDQCLEIAAKKPGFKVTMLKVRKSENPENNGFINTMFWGKKDVYSFVPIYKYHFDKQNIVIEEFTGLQPNDGDVKTYNIADVVYAFQNDNEETKYDGSTITFKTFDGKSLTKSTAELQKSITNDLIISKTFWLGTDRYGRDLLSQLMIGTRVSLSVGFISVFISLLIGIFLGAVAGFFRGWVDNVIVWIINVVWSIPTLLLVIAITFALGKGFWQVFIAVGLTMWVEVARVVRGQILGIREKEYVEAAKALGLKNFRIIFKHILPNVMGSVIVISAANFASAILIEAGLSFLGIGVQPPMPSWGTMIKEHYAYIILDAAYLALIPGFAIMITVLAFMLIGNALRDALDVKIEIS
jgi:peptide/nickel transport system permease protein